MNKAMKLLFMAGIALTVGFIIHVIPALADATGDLLPNNDGSYTQWTPLSTSWLTSLCVMV